jgi:PadR family transcriptional regulator PadR
MNSFTQREQLKGWLELIVLSILHHEPTCGYRLKKMAIHQSNHQFSPAFGRLYPLLADMEKSGLLKSRKEAGGTRGQTIYSLTHRGEERLTVLKQNWSQFSHAMNRITSR